MMKALTSASSIHLTAVFALNECPSASSPPPPQRSFRRRINPYLETLTVWSHLRWHHCRCCRAVAKGPIARGKSQVEYSKASVQSQWSQVHGKHRVWIWAETRCWETARHNWDAIASEQRRVAEILRYGQLLLSVYSQTVGNYCAIATTLKERSSMFTHQGSLHRLRKITVRLRRNFSQLYLGARDSNTKCMAGQLKWTQTTNHLFQSQWSRWLNPLQGFSVYL